MAIWMIGLFSAGLAATLLIIGVLTVKARSALARFSRFEKIAGALPVISSVIVTVIGLIIVFESVGSLRSW